MAEERDADNRVEIRAYGVTFAATRPLAIATVDEQGISIDIRPRFARRVALLMVRLGYGSSAAQRFESTFWQADWGELSRIDWSRRGLVLNVPGRRCWFGTKAARGILPIVDYARARGVPIQRVRSTMFWYRKD